MDLVKRRLLNMAFFTLLGVGALGLFFWQQNKSEVDEQSEKVSKRVLTEFQPSSVNVLSLQTPKNNYKLQREESGEWFIVEPEKTLADSAVIDSIVQQLSTLSFESMMGESQKEGEPEPSLDLALFSLAPPLFTLTLEGPAMSPQTLQVGKVNRFDGSVYAKSAASEQVGLVLKSVHYLVDKNLYALREKRVVLFEPADVQALDIKFEKSEGDYRLERVGEFFEVIKDGRFRVDQAQIDGILNELKILKAQLFVRDSIQDKNPNKQNAVQKYGLDKPVVSISMEFAGDRKSVTLDFSQVKLEKVTRNFVYRGEGYPVFGIGSDSVLHKVAVNISELKDRHLAYFDRSAVRSMSIKSGADFVEFEKKLNLEKERESWVFRADEGEDLQDAQDAQDARLEGILYKLETMKSRLLLKDGASDAELKAVGLLPEPTKEIILYGAEREFLAHFRFGMVEDDDRFSTSKWGSQDFGRIDMVSRSLIDDISAVKADYQVQEN